MTIKSLFESNRYYFFSYFILMLFAMFILLTYSKEEGYLLMNPYHRRPLDTVFMVLTILGDGWFVVAVGILCFLFKRKFLSLMIIVSYLFSGLIVQIIKNLIDAPRPSKFLQGTGYPNFIDGYTLSNYSSFPSGHTTSAFALATILAFWVQDKNYSILFLLLAAVAGYSRIYLGQHFMEDVLAGSSIGVSFAMISAVFFSSFFMRITRSNRGFSGYLPQK